MFLCGDYSFIDLLFVLRTLNGRLELSGCDPGISEEE